MTEKLIWWEKTVEYKFIIDASEKHGLDFAAPLSGIQEMAGDGIFSSDAKLILVEFKRSINEIKSEKDKFTCYEKAKKKLKGRDGHHFLIYGYPKDSELELEACQYFSVTKTYPYLSIFDKGLEDEKFKEYLKELIALKKIDKRSGGKVGPEFVASVIGISSGTPSSISFTEYVKKALPELYQTLVPTQRPSNNLTNG